MLDEHRVLIEESKRFRRQRDEARKVAVDLYLAVWRTFFHDLECPALNVPQGMRLPKDCTCKAHAMQHDEPLDVALDAFVGWACEQVPDMEEAIGR